MQHKPGYRIVDLEQGPSYNGAGELCDLSKSHRRKHPERSSPMGDKKSKKDKAKGQRQKDAKQAKIAKQKQARQQPRT